MGFDIMICQETCSLNEIIGVNIVDCFQLEGYSPKKPTDSLIIS